MTLGYPDISITAAPSPSAKQATSVPRPSGSILSMSTTSTCDVRKNASAAPTVFTELTRYSNSSEATKTSTMSGSSSTIRTWQRLVIHLSKRTSARTDRWASTSIADLRRAARMTSILVAALRADNIAASTLGSVPDDSMASAYEPEPVLCSIIYRAQPSDFRTMIFRPGISVETLPSDSVCQTSRSIVVCPAGSVTPHESRGESADQDKNISRSNTHA